jgi:hypothetical protein
MKSLGSVITTVALVSMSADGLAGDTPTSSARSSSCSAPEYHQFDFWIGKWLSYEPGGALQGHLTVRPILAGCVLEEIWSGTDGGEGRSFSIYDKIRGVWNQTWVSSHGTLLPLEGRLVGRSMVLTGMHAQPDGLGALHRTIWTPLPNGQVHQVWDLSLDGGQSWQINYDGLLKRDVAP